MYHSTHRLLAFASALLLSLVALVDRVDAQTTQPKTVTPPSPTPPKTVTPAPTNPSPPKTVTTTPTNPPKTLRPTLPERSPASEAKFTPPIVRTLPQINSAYIGGNSLFPMSNMIGQTYPYMSINPFSSYLPSYNPYGQNNYYTALTNAFWGINNPWTGLNSPFGVPSNGMLGMNVNGFNNPFATSFVGFNNPLGVNGFNNPLGVNGFNNPLGVNGFNNPMGVNGFNNPLGVNGFNNPLGANGFNNPLGMNFNGFNPGFQMNGVNGMNGLPQFNPNVPKFNFNGM